MKIQQFSVDCGFEYHFSTPQPPTGLLIWLEYTFSSCQILQGKLCKKRNPVLDMAWLLWDADILPNKIQVIEILKENA